MRPAFSDTVATQPTRDRTAMNELAAQQPAPSAPAASGSFLYFSFAFAFAFAFAFTQSLLFTASSIRALSKYLV